MYAEEEENAHGGSGSGSGSGSGLAPHPAMKKKVHVDATTRESELVAEAVGAKAMLTQPVP